VLRHLPPVVDPRVLVGATTSDDAAVYRLSEELALVATLDFITPVVDDPEQFGAVAAANALSDVFAMGARPIFALNVVNFPRERLPLHYLEAILRGGAAKAQEAGVPIVGGHSVDDPELKYGLVAIGLVHPGRIITNAGARPGDRLVLTKPLGLGVVTTAIKADRAGPELIRGAVEVMTTLNSAAALAMVDVGVNAATDVTGFGLLGHLAEMVRASAVGATILTRAVPVLPEARSLARDGLVPGGSRRNLDAVEAIVDWNPDLDAVDRILLADAQTSGGLLIAVPEAGLARLLERLRSTPTTSSAVIGQITDRPGRIQVS
jgi:selenide, water dikinase